MDRWDVPVIGDSLKQVRDGQLLRCTFFYVEVDEFTPIRSGSVRGLGGPALLLGTRAVVIAPSWDKPVFETAKDIEQLFSAIETEEDRAIANGTVWLPSWGQRTTGSEAESLHGHVIRVPEDAFALCLSFGRNRVTLDEFRTQWAPFADAVHPSDTETAAFGEWTRSRIDTLSSWYHNSPDRFVGRKERE
ncbi:MAG: hypothetical protein KAI66_19830 [Lentisphaeria bacterium]|nr:hypothetical protein [Lentisphaeria bacterium]